MIPLTFIAKHLNLWRIYALPHTTINGFVDVCVAHHLRTQCIIIVVGIVEGHDWLFTIQERMAIQVEFMRQVDNWDNHYRDLGIVP